MIPVYLLQNQIVIDFQLFPHSFNIDPSSGLISVKPCLQRVGEPPCIDFETKKRYVLTVSATDNNGQQVGGRRRSVQIIINILDRNDNPPRPEQNYLRYINEGQTVTINPLIVTVSLL